MYSNNGMIKFLMKYQLLIFTCILTSGLTHLKINWRKIILRISSINHFRMFMNLLINSMRSIYECSGKITALILVCSPMIYYQIQVIQFSTVSNCSCSKKILYRNNCRSYTIKNCCELMRNNWKMFWYHSHNNL